MIYNALITVKSLTYAKSRLSPYLTQTQRETLVLDMLHHVLRTLPNSGLLELVSVVSPDKDVLQLARQWGAQALPEEVFGHNPALQAAALRQQRVGIPSTLSPNIVADSALLTISADLPLLEISDIHA